MKQPTYPPHSRRPHKVWATARAEYENGGSIRVIAERHGLNIRTVSRHARAEGWKAPHIPSVEAYAAHLAARGYDPSALAEMLTVNHVVHQDDATLLLRPDTIGLCRFAFRRAAESAGVSGPTEALAWLRLAEATARLRRAVDVDVRPMSEADYHRIAALARHESCAAMEAITAAPPEEPGPVTGEQEPGEVSETVP